MVIFSGHVSVHRFLDHATSTQRFRRLEKNFLGGKADDDSRIQGEQGRLETDPPERIIPILDLITRDDKLR